MFAHMLRRFWSPTRISIICLMCRISRSKLARESFPVRLRFNWLSQSEFRLTNAKQCNREAYERSVHGQFGFSRRNTTGFSGKFRSSDAGILQAIISQEENDPERQVRLKSH